MARRATAALISSRFDDASSISQEAAHYGERIGEPDARNVAACQTWDIDRFTGRRLDRPPGARFAPEFAGWPVWRAIILADAGESALARAAMAGVDTNQGWDPGVQIGPDPWSMAVMAEAVAAAGTDEDRPRLRRTLTPLSGTHVVAVGLATYSGPVDYHLGLLAVTRAGSRGSEHASDEEART